MAPTPLIARYSILKSDMVFDTVAGQGRKVEVEEVKMPWSCVTFRAQIFLQPISQERAAGGIISLSGANGI
jgi:hypothetical protein